MSWTEQVTAIATVAGTVVLVASLYWGWRTYNLSAQQEKRKVPKLSISILTSEITTQMRAYQLSISNPTDIENSISYIEIKFAYISRGRTVIAKLKEDCNQNLSYPKYQLKIPSHISAHDTISGWCFFPLPSGLLTKDNVVVSRELVITDGNAIETTLEIL